MSWRIGRGLPIFWQTLLLLLASLLVAQAVSIGLFLSLKPPRPDFNRLSDVADALAADRAEPGRRDRGLIARRLAGPPVVPAGMATSSAFTGILAARLGASPERVRLFFEPDQRRRWPSGDGKTEGMVPIRRGEPIFFDRVIAGIDTGQGWRVVQTAPRPLIGAWQRRSLLWFAVSALLLLPFAWFFARRLTRPIRRFADAADRMGADPLAPHIAEEGPAELRVTAHALNRMQDRLGSYVAERTAMIGAIAHDLRTPLARIAFRIEGAPDSIREKVQADIEQMRSMIAATIGFVRDNARPLDREPLALAPLLEEIAAAEREMGRTTAVTELESVTVDADRVAIARLFQNLIDNGLSYGGAIEVALRREAREAVVTVADRGPGLSPDLLERVFEPFERGDPSRNRGTGGIGLGLTIARSIAQAHGGRVILSNRPGGGLAAEVRLPIHDRHAGS